jgi:hypothetical protein
VEQGKGVNVVRFQDGIAKVLQRPMAGIRTMSPRYLSASAVAKLRPQDGNVRPVKRRGVR